MKRMKLLALLAVLALFAAACGGSDSDDESSASASDGDDTAEVDAGDEEEPADDGDEEEPADDGDEEEPADDGGEEEPADDGGEEEPADDGEDAAPAGEAGQGGDLLLLQWQAPSQANAYLSTGTKDLLASSIVLEPLAQIDPDGNIVPNLVDEIPTVDNGGISADGTQITWTLSEGLLWSDGTPVTSADVVFSWEYCVAEASSCSAEVFVGVASVEAVDDLTVTITFEEETPYPFQPFVSYNSPVIQQAQFADCVGAAAVGCSEQNFAPIGTGAYMVTELRPEDTVVYEMNPNYRGISEGKPFFGTVTIKGGGDAEAAARSVLEIGEADYAWNLQVAPEILGPMEAVGNGEVVVSFGGSSVEHINLNQTNNRVDGDEKSSYLDGTNPHPILFENPDLARALSLAISRDDLVTVGYGATGSPTCNIWNVGSQTSTNNDWCLTQDIEEANRILDEDLGYIDNDGDGIRELPDGTPLEFEFVTSTNAVRQSNQDLIKAFWEEIGVATNMRNEDASLFFDGTSASDASIWKFFSDMEMFTNSASNPDPGSYLNGWLSTSIPELSNSWGGNNMPRMVNAEYDEVYAELAATPLSDPARDELAIRLNDILSAESGAVIPLVARGSVSAFSTAMENTGVLNGWDSEYWNIADWTRSE